ncbi:hypothetical protein CBR_g30342 [Chara braunii]|uniref:acetyl-CoA carboxytransferase n=1 Tax=Chara braunii TaxID=69332 RepID=A0A388JX62_CHABU|nr:hypothetical protein CBR_g30342 [Chara braunii]|eukprot:GBG62389.1 hypothetical protein CBR_g30342 [Chara braunii]
MAAMAAVAGCLTGSLSPGLQAAKVSSSESDYGVGNSGAAPSCSSSVSSSLVRSPSRDAAAHGRQVCFHRSFRREMSGTRLALGGVKKRSGGCGASRDRLSTGGPVHSVRTERGRRGLGGVAIAMAKKPKRDPDYPWPDKFQGAKPGFLSFLSKFKPVSGAKGKPLMLPFEKPLIELEQKIVEVREIAKKTGMDFSTQLLDLEAKYEQLRREIYLRLTPVQRLSVARHPNRPTFLDHVLNITDKWVELHGDRGGFDDPALVCGIGKMENMSFMFMGHQKGRNTKENIHRNFGMPTPNGYRKALRLMRHAAHHGFPILTFIDTPGAYAGVSAEELGQGEAIAHNLREMFGLKVPVITTVIGEGGSGGALAIGCCNKMLMLENAVYYVASPEACAAILWKDATAAPKATEALRITGKELQQLNVVDEVIPEPLGGAHADPVLTSNNIKQTILRHMDDLLKMSGDELMKQRLAKFRQMGAYKEVEEVEPRKTRNMKPADIPVQDHIRTKVVVPSVDGVVVKSAAVADVNSVPVNSTAAHLVN